MIDPYYELGEVSVMFDRDTRDLIMTMPDIVTLKEVRDLRDALTGILKELENEEYKDSEH